MSFREAIAAFYDPQRVVAKDVSHSSRRETRYFCFGLDQMQSGILTVRFTYRHSRIRIIGAGYWRRGRQIYEQENSIQRRPHR
ncbi:MAG: BrnT family toxin [Gammaproteobacteria bacterium]